MNDRFKFRFYAVNYKTYVDATIESFIGSDMIPIWKNGNFLTMEKTTDVIPEQCTGLKDKNGKLIYEGDIVADEFNDKMLVCWDNEYLQFCFQKDNDWYVHTNAEIEVIGNIHENADLMEINNE